MHTKTDTYAKSLSVSAYKIDYEQPNMQTNKQAKKQIHFDQSDVICTKLKKK